MSGRVILLVILCVISIVVLSVFAFNNVMPTPVVDVDACMSGKGTMEVGAARECVEIKLRTERERLYNESIKEQQRAQAVANQQWEDDTRLARQVLYHAMIIGVSLFLVIALPMSGAAVGNWMRVRSYQIHARRGLFPVTQVRIGGKLVQHNPNTGDMTVLSIPTTADTMKAIAKGEPAPKVNLELQTNQGLLADNYRQQTYAQVASAASYAANPARARKEVKADLPGEGDDGDDLSFDIKIVKQDSLKAIDPTSQHKLLTMDDDV